MRHGEMRLWMEVAVVRGVERVAERNGLNAEKSKS
jgi:hypothetical protein